MADKLKRQNELTVPSRVPLSTRFRSFVCLFFFLNRVKKKKQKLFLQDKWCVC